jgi:hypothetical protein
MPLAVRALQRAQRDGDWDLGFALGDARWERVRGTLQGLCSTCPQLQGSGTPVDFTLPCVCCPEWGRREVRVFELADCSL